MQPQPELVRAARFLGLTLQGAGLAHLAATSFRILTRPSWAMERPDPPQSHLAEDTVLLVYAAALFLTGLWLSTAGRHLREPGPRGPEELAQALRALGLLLVLVLSGSLLLTALPT